MKVLLVIAVALVGIASCFPFVEEWETWKSLYNKKYTTQEEELRRQIIWKANKKYVEEHNAQKEKFGYTLEMNQFGDLSEVEFSKMYNTFNMDSVKNRGNLTKTYVPKNLKVPTSWDWRSYNYVTEVKNQGQCGSCWSFATTGSLEAQYAKSKGTLVSLSEQQLVDCATSYGEHGCKGGNVDLAFTYIKYYGIESEASYPYTAEDDYCQYDSSKVVTKLSSYVDITRYSESDLLEACYENGPIAVAIDASHRDFQLYSSGVYSNSACSSTSLDHGVLVVGFGTYGGQDYWLVKNSWGPSWGINGYFMLARNQENMCGVATMASYPVL